MGKIGPWYSWKGLPNTVGPHSTAAQEQELPYETPGLLKSLNVGNSPQNKEVDHSNLIQEHLCRRIIASKSGPLLTFCKKLYTLTSFEVIEPPYI